MKFAPGSDFYVAIAQVIPLFMITLVLEDRVFKLWHERIKHDRYAPMQFVAVGGFAELLALFGLACHLAYWVNVALGLVVGSLTTYLLIFVCTSLIDIADPNAMKHLPGSGVRDWLASHMPPEMRETAMETAKEMAARKEAGNPMTRKELRRRAAEAYKTRHERRQQYEARMAREESQHADEQTPPEEGR